MSAVLDRAQDHAGTLEAAKWIALACMVVDHVNAVFYARELGMWADVLGRIAFPMFAAVVGFNLARPGRDLIAAARKFALWGLLALPFHAALFAQAGGWWPLNVLFLFALVAGVQRLGSRSWPAALAAFVIGGFFVEYWHAGVMLTAACYVLARLPYSQGAAAGVALSLVALCLLNGNAYALLAVPVLAGLAMWRPILPRSPRAFWWFYPGHLAALWLAA